MHSFSQLSFSFSRIQSTNVLRMYLSLKHYEISFLFLPTSFFFFLVPKTIWTNLFLPAHRMTDFQSRHSSPLFRWSLFCLVWPITSGRPNPGNTWPQKQLGSGGLALELINQAPGTSLQGQRLCESSLFLSAASGSPNPKYFFLCSDLGLHMLRSHPHTS